MMIGTSASLVLASASPRRVRLLKELGLHPLVEPAGVSEVGAEWGGPEGMVAENARLKAETVAARHPNLWVLGADTTVTMDGRVFGKPADLDQARAMLLRLSGRDHQVLTGMHFVHLREGIRHHCVESTRVVFRRFDEALVDEYFREVDPLDKAGAYGIQERGDLLLERLEGSWSNVVGLPVERLRPWLYEAGFGRR